MRTATESTTDLFAGPVLIVRPGFQGHVIQPGDRHYEDACRLSAKTGSLALVALDVVASGTRSAFELLDNADACWEDAEWQ